MNSTQTGSVAATLVVVAVSVGLLVAGCGGGDGDGGEGNATAELQKQLQNYGGNFRATCPGSIPTDGTKFTCTVTKPDGTKQEVTGSFNGDVWYFDLNPLGTVTLQQP